MIKQLKDFPTSTVAFACHGHVTRDDYLDTLVPAVERTFAQHENVRLYYEIGPDFETIDMGAFWTDFTTGLKHWMQWERIAIVTDVQWIRNTIYAFGFLMPGHVKLFAMVDKAAAREWIAGK